MLDGTPVTALERRGDFWVADNRIEAPVVVGAGGHFCPVARLLRGGADTSRPVVAKEVEFRLDGDGAGAVSDAPELFFCRDLEGYGWCVRKGNYLNVGIGRRESRDFGRHVKDFIAYLEQHYSLTAPAEVPWRGHAYLASGAGPRPLVGPGMLVVGDAAGLAYPESGEGICPAIESGHLAAETLISASRRFAIEDLQPYADAMRRLHPPAAVTPNRFRAAVVAIGRMLLGSPTFTRRVVLDRWFLRA